MIRVPYRNNDFFVKLATAADKEDCTATIICYGRACACALYGATICAGDNCTLAYRHAVCSKRKRACSCVFDAFLIRNGYTAFYGNGAFCCIYGITAFTAFFCKFIGFFAYFCGHIAARSALSCDKRRYTVIN